MKHRPIGTVPLLTPLISTWLPLKAGCISPRVIVHASHSTFILPTLMAYEWWRRSDELHSPTLTESASLSKAHHA